MKRELSMKFSVLAIFLVCCATLCPQAAPPVSGFTIDANVSRASDGAISVTSNSTRPLWQTVEGVKRRYGWTIDYEDPLYSSDSDQITSDSVHGRYLKGGKFISHFHEPKNSSSDEETRILRAIVDQYNTQFLTKYRVLKISDYRFDIAPTQSILDQPIKIDSETRSLRAEVDEIMASLTNATGIRVEHGGLIDNAMEQTQVSLKHADALPARQLLNEVLDHAPVQKTWVFTFNPDGGTCAIGVQTTQQWIMNENGKISVKTLSNPHFALSQNK
jgi:hypothetical protein